MGAKTPKIMSRTCSLGTFDGTFTENHVMSQRTILLAILQENRVSFDVINILCRRLSGSELSKMLNINDLK